MDEKKETSRFKFDADDGSATTTFQEDLKDLRIDKLSRKVLFLSILTPCLFAVILFFVYFDLKHKLLVNQDTGTKNVESLSKDIDSRVYGLSSKYEELEKSLNTKTDDLEKKYSSIKSDLKKTNHSLKKLHSAKVDKKEYQKTAGELKNISSQVTEMEDLIAKKFSDLSEIVDQAKKDLASLRTDISASIKDKIDKKLLDQKLQEAQKSNKDRLNLSAKRLENKIQSIQNQIKELKNITNQITKKSQPKAKKPTPKNPPPEEKKSETGDTDNPVPGDIEEQDL